MNDNIYYYGTDIHKRPELLMTSAELFPQVRRLENFWREKSKSYRIDFFVTTDQAHRFSFELDEYRGPPYEGWDELDDDLKLKSGCYHTQ